MTGSTFSNAQDLALILEAAKHAASIAMKYFRRAPEITIKGDASPVTEADLAIDVYLHDFLREARPDYGWLSEERDDDGSRHTSDRSFVVDPIDGTRAFIAETDEWCISIGLVEGGRPVAGVLHCPVNGKVYSAISGKGAFCDGVQIFTRQKQSAEFRVAGPKPLIRAIQEQNSISVRAMPYVPSLALRLAMVAEGQIDATLVKPKSAFWDIAAADIIVAESSCSLVNLDGTLVDYTAASPKLGTMVAASNEKTGEILAVVRTLSIG